MPVLIPCPKCERPLKVPAENLGHIGRCKKCGAVFPLIPPTRADDGDPLARPIPGAGYDLPAAIGPYRVIRELGRGSMGVVYLAEDPDLDRQVALKIPLNLAKLPGTRRRFLREARAAARFLHPNFCPIHQIGEIAGTPYLVMAFIEGTTLSGLIAPDRPWPARKAAELAQTLALALAEAHRKGIIHRDLKPANVMIDPRGRPFVMDFGLARRTEPARPHSTEDGTILGTATYMAPEQARGHVSEVDERSDVYSLGVILHELLTGRPPFEAEFAWQVLAQVVGAEPPTPSAFNPAVDPDLESIVLAAMAREPGRRLASMDLLAGRLAGWLDRDGSAPHAPADVEATAAFPPEAGRIAIVGSSIRRPRVGRGWTRPALIAATLMLLVLGVLSLLKTRGRRVDLLSARASDEPTARLIRLATIPAGEFLMGAPSGEADSLENEKPAHRVRITRPFLLGETEVTQAEYIAVMGGNPSSFSAGGGRKDDVAGQDTGNFPVENVSHGDAITFCNRLSLREGLTPYYTPDGKGILSGDGYRLPTEAEWEYACRAGTTTAFAFGNQLPPAYANFGANVGRTTPARTYPANKFGLHDMHGNVFEWCSDWYNADSYKAATADDPEGWYGGMNRVFRGGGWSYGVPNCRSACRNQYPPDTRHPWLGFRVARTPTPGE